MNYKVLITGSTGMVGKGVLYECMDHPAISGILLLNRRAVGIDHPKITELILEQFDDFSQLPAEFLQVDACFFCMGISALGKSEQEYTRITHDITLNLARKLSGENPEMLFCYVSGQGTNANSKTMWARVKGVTEQELQQLPFKKVVLFRPGFIQPRRGIRSATGWYNLIYKISTPFYPLLKRLSGNAITNTTNVGLAMINCLLVENHPMLLDNREINRLANSASNF
ncbi:MAG: epimerase [Cyclobacteriaceae bacterium]|nr:MAG: epimerase [Cyclobacteriaceae bacterium]